MSLRMKKELNNFIDKGFRYAYAYRPDATLQDALTYKLVATCETMARQKALSAHYKGEKEVKVWELKKELVYLSKE